MCKCMCACVYVRVFLIYHSSPQLNFALSTANHLSFAGAATAAASLPVAGAAGHRSGGD